MLRLLHFADLHLGVESYGRPDPQTGLSSRVGDFLAALDFTVDWALENSIDLVLFCGDAYKSREPSPTLQREFARRMGRLASAGVKVFLLAGNHDLPHAPSRATSIDIFDTLAVDNITVADRPQVHRIQTKSGPVQVVALPWMNRSQLLTKEEARNLPLDELTRLMERKLVEDVIPSLGAQLDPGIPAVLAAHLAVTSARLGSEQSLMASPDYILPPSALFHPKLDYIALGHVHRHQKLPGMVPTVYAGSLVPIDFGDADQERGFYEVELDGAPRQAQDGAQPPGERLRELSFHPAPSRQLRKLGYTVPESVDDPTPWLRRRLEAEAVDGAIVRVEVKLSRDQDAQLNEAEVRRALASAHLVDAIIRQVDREARARWTEQGVEGLSPLGALELFLQTRKVSPKRAQALMERAAVLLQEAETTSPGDGSGT